MRATAPPMLGSAGAAGRDDGIHVTPAMINSKGNLLLASLPAADRQRLIGDLTPVELRLSETLIEPGERVRHVYFPIDGFISLITPGLGRAQLEIGLVGGEGMLGVPLLLGVDDSPLRALVQGAGHAWRIDADAFRREIERTTATHAAFNRYVYVFMAQLMQTATCTRFHLVEARLARWLLMTRDRARANRFHITHEFLAFMLGVRRVGVTTAAIELQRRKLIRYSRGDIVVLDVPGLQRAACPCYSIDKKIYARILRPRKVTREGGARNSSAQRLAAQIVSSISC
jgi:CRP-like cAMP-binding protein